MEKKGNRILSMLLVLAMVISMLPMSVIATEPEPEGTGGSNTTEPEYLVNWDFEDGNAQGTSDNLSVFETVEKGGNHVLHVGGGTVSNRNDFWYIDDDVIGSQTDITITYNIAIGNAGKIVYFPAPIPGTSHTGQFFKVRNMTTGKLQFEPSGSAADSVLVDEAEISTKANRWYTVKMVYSKNGESYVEIDGNRTNVGLGSTSSNPVSMISMRFYKGHVNEAYLDNIRVTVGGVDHDAAVPTACLCPSPSWSNGVCSGCQAHCEHSWTEASCAEAKHCVNCGQTEGNSLGHSYTGANGVCVNGCGNTEQKNYLLENALVYQDFEGDDPETGVTNNTDTLTYGTAEVVDFNGNSVLKLASGANIADATFRWYYPVSTSGLSKVTVTYNVAAVNGNFLWFPSPSKTTYPADVQFGVYGGAMQQYTGAAWAPLTAGEGEDEETVSYEKLRWHTVKIVYSRTDSSTCEVSVSLDGRQTNAGVANGHSNIKNIAAQIFKNQAGSMYIDNICVTAGDVDHDAVAPTACLCGENSDWEAGVCQNCQAHCEHNWTEATCAEAKHCVNCGQTEGDSLGHIYTGANGVCVNGCGRTEEQNYILANYLAYFDFEDGEARGQFSGANGTATVKDVNGNKLLSLKSDGASSVRWYYPLGGSYSNVTMTYHVAVVSPYNQLRVTFPTVSDAQYHVTNAEFGIIANNMLSWSPDGTARPLVTSATDSTVNIAYKQMKWYTVKVVYSTDGTTSTAKVYIDGMLTNVESRKATEITHLAVKFYTGSEMEIYVDNIRVSEGDHDGAPVTCLGECSFDQRVVSDAYKASSASCTKSATYYYSCVCGEKGTATFESGDPLAHSYTGANGVCVNGCGRTEAQNEILATYLAYLDFEDGEVRGAMTAANGTATVKDANGNKLLSLKSDGTSNVRWYYPLGGSYSNVTMTYHVAVVSPYNQLRVTFPTVSDTQYHVTNAEFGIVANNKLSWSPDGTARPLVTSSTDSTVNIAYKQMKWYTVKVVYSTDGTTSTAKVYIDGMLTNVESRKATEITHLAVKFYTGSEMEIYVDNIRVSESGHDGAPVTCLGDCSFDQRVVSDAYKASSASCTKSATYYYSCVCGEKGTATFESGDPLAHSYTGANGVCVNGCGRTQAQNEILATYLAYLDFEDGEVRGAMTTANGTATVKDIDGNKLLSLKADGIKNVRWYYPLGGSYSNVTMTYHVAVVSPYNQLRVTFPTVSDADYHVTNAEFGIVANNKLSWSPDGTARPLVTSATDSTVNIAYKQMKWYTVKVVYSTDGTTSTAKVYIDGMLTNVESRRATEITHLAVKFYTGSEMEIYVDNIRVSENGHDGAPVTCLGECSFDQRVVSDYYKASSASCTMAATYYYSCVCGEKGTATFESGEPLAHSYTGANGVCVNGCGKTKAENDIIAKYLAYFDFEDGLVRGQFSGSSGSAEVIELFGNKMLMLKTDGAAATDWYYSLGGSYQNVTMTYNVAVVSSLTSSLVMFPTVTDKNQFRPNVEFGVNKNGELRKYYGSTWGYVGNASIANANVSAKQSLWHTVKIVYSSVDQTAKVYIDGVLTDVEPNKTTDITKIAVRFYKNGGYQSKIYVDNIRVSVDDHDAATPAPLESGEHGFSYGQIGFVGEGSDFTLDFEDIPVNYYPGTLVASAYQKEDSPGYYLGVKEINGNKVLYMEGHGNGENDAISWTYKLNRSYQKATLSYYVAEVTKEPFLITYPTISNRHYWRPVAKIGLAGNYGGEVMWYRENVGWKELTNPQTDEPIRNKILEWHQVKIVYDANDGNPTVAVYFDGVLTNAGSPQNATSDEITYISVRMNGNRYYGGKLYMDNFRFSEGDHEPLAAPKSLISDTKASSMTVDCSSLNLTVGGHQYITPTVSPAEIADKTVTYTSSNPNVATVDEWGEVHGVSAGSAVITVTSNSNTAVKVQIPVTVTNRGTMKTIYVSPNGGGNGTTANSRCTLQEAMAQVSALHSSMTGDIVVSLAAGYYQLKETLKFDVTHGGTNNYYVSYKAEGEVTFGGKQVITGWTEYKNGIYCAPAAGIQSRHLYVNNIRAVMARSEGRLLNAEFLVDANGKVVGYTSDNVELAQYAHPEDIEFVYHHRWINSYCVVDNVALNSSKDKVNITMSQPLFTWQRAEVEESTRYLAYYQNALELLDEPGEWYLDTHAGVVYYMPRSWEDIRSVEISIPVTEELISIEGAAYDNKVQNIEFVGITFADATWNYITEMGGLAVDQNNHLEEYNVYSDKLIDGSVVLKKANSINFTGCTFTRLGNIGLKMVDGVQNSMIIGNKFYDISGGALSVGEPDYFNVDVCNPSDPAMMMKNCDIINNYIHDVGCEYQSSAGLSVGYAADMDISHNEIFDVPYSGMHIGYGWKIRYDTIFKNMKITNNFIHDTGWGDVNDGGPIYVNGDSAGTKENPNIIANNYIARSYQAVSAIYLDGGASGWYTTNNFIDEKMHENSWYIVWNPFSNKQERQWVENNYITYDDDKIHPMPSWGQFEIEPAVVVDSEKLPAEVLSIISGAGLESAYHHLRGAFAELISVNFDKELEIRNAGDTFQVVATAYDGLGNVITNADMSVYYSIEDNAIATVNGDGVVTAVATGITVLKMTVITEGVVKEYTYNVVVGDILNEIVIENSNTLDGGISFYLSTDGFVPVVIGKTVLGRTVSVTDFDLAIADTSIAYLDGKTIIPKSAGKTTVTITGRYDGVERTGTFSLEIKGSTDNQDNGPTLTGMPDIFNKAYQNYWMFVSNYEPKGGVQYGDGTIKMEGQYNATFAGATYLSELLTVGMHIDTATVGTGLWPTIMIRNQNYKKLVTDGTGYLFIFVEDTGIELHRYNNGKRTQIYGDVLGFKSVAGSGIMGAYKDNTYYEVQVGAINEADGVRLILRLNGVEIINFLDTDPLAIREEGYFGICGRYEIITLTYIPVDSNSDSACVDANKDHKCDDCGKSVGIHMPIIGGHHCDYCGEIMTECSDPDRDHFCDDCEAELSTCADTDNNHKCDVCGLRLSFCEDEDGDHHCEMCGRKIRCKDKDHDHLCDMCGEAISECADRQGKDHLCDVCDKRLTECVNEDNDHVCDYCGAPLTPCVDADGDLKCDMCGADIDDTQNKPGDNINGGDDNSPTALIVSLLVLAVLAVGGALVILIIRKKRSK